MTPSRRRSRAWTPQKQPPARIAVSVLSLMWVLLDSEVLCQSRRPPPNSSSASRKMLKMSRKIAAARGIGGAGAQAVEVEDRERAEDPESGDRVDEVAVGDRYEDRNDAEDDQAEQGPNRGGAHEERARRVA